MEKGFTQSWSTEIYAIESKETASGGTVYCIKELAGEKLDGRSYPWELQKASDDNKEKGQ